MRAKWYIRLLLFFHPMMSTVSNYTRSGEGMKLTLRYKEFNGTQYVYEEIKEIYTLKGKHNRRARRSRNGKTK